MARIKLRRDTSSNWTSVNPVLDSGEPGYETNTNRIKYGNGVSAWNSLPYFSTEFNGGTINQPLIETAGPSSNHGAIELSGSTTSSNLNVGLLQVGSPLSISDRNILASMVDNVNSYTQVIIQNKNSGTAASTDFIVNNNQGSTVYGDFGVNSTGFVGTSGPFDTPNATYVLSAGGQLSLGTLNNHEVKIATNDATRITVDNAGPVTFERYSPVTILSTVSASAHDQGALVVAGGVGVGEDVVVDGSIYIGRGAVTAGFTAPTIIAKQAGQQFIQAALVNSDNRGSADWVAYGNNGNETNGWADFGFTGSAYSDTNFTITGPNDGYFFVSGFPSPGAKGNLVLATDGSGTTNDLIFATGGFLSANEKMRFVHSTGQFYVQTGTSSSNTTTGAIRVNGGVGVSENLNVGGTINKVTITAPTNGSTLTIVDGKTITFNQSLTFPSTTGSANNVLVTNGSGTLSWVAPGSNISQLTNGSFTAALTSTGSLNLPYSTRINNKDTVTCAPASNTVIYTGSDQYQNTIKILVKVEGVAGNVAGSEPADWDTQSCEIMVAKSFKSNNVVASVYGITYTSAAPLATFTANWNSGSNRVEVKCQPISTVNNVYVRASAIEITTSN